MLPVDDRKWPVLSVFHTSFCTPSECDQATWKPVSVAVAPTAVQPANWPTVTSPPLYSSAVLIDPPVWPLNKVLLIGSRLFPPNDSVVVTEATVESPLKS